MQSTIITEDPKCWDTFLIFLEIRLDGMICAQGHTVKQINESACNIFTETSSESSNSLS